jgi:hypothetical protein
VLEAPAAGRGLTGRDHPRDGRDLGSVTGPAARGHREYDRQRAHGDDERGGAWGERHA